MTFLRAITKRNLVKAVRTRKRLCTSEIGFVNESEVYINEELGRGALEIYTEARKLKKQKVIANTWTSEGKVFYKVKIDGQPKLCHSIEDLFLLTSNVPQITPGARTRGAIQEAKKPNKGSQ